MLCRHHRIVALALCLVVPAAVRAQPTPRVALIGDSHMEVLGPMVARRLRAGGIRGTRVFAIRGSSSPRACRELDFAELRQVRPSLVVVALGSNDYGVRRAARYRGRVEPLVDALRAAGVPRIVWYGPPAVDASRSERNERIAANHVRVASMQAEVFPLLEVPWVDSWPVTVGRNGPDGVHLTMAGYQLWADAIAASVLHRGPLPDAPDSMRDSNEEEERQ